MEISLVDQLSALSHPQRMNVFQLLMRRYPNAVAAGDIVSALRLKPSTASVYLSALLQAGLISQSRNGTRLLYAVRLDAAHDMVASLLADCCRGRPDLCPAPRLNIQDVPFSVLFVCTGNSARSIMAEAILRDVGRGQFTAFSAGTHPRLQAHPLAVATLQHHGHDTRDLKSKDVSTFRGSDAPRIDFTFTVCDLAANEACPTFSDLPIASHWGLPDPAANAESEAQMQQAFEATYAALHRHITDFVSLPFETSDRATLQSRVDAIGRQCATQDLFL